MLQMVRTLAQFSIALEEMNEHGEKEGDEGGGGGERDGGGGDVVDRDAVDQFRSNNRNGNSSGNLNGNGLCAGNPNGEVDLCFLVFGVKICVCVFVCVCVTLPAHVRHERLPVQVHLDFPPVRLPSDFSPCVFLVIVAHSSLQHVCCLSLQILLSHLSIIQLELSESTLRVRNSV